MTSSPDEGRRPGAVALANGQAKRANLADAYTPRAAEDAEKSLLGGLLQMGTNWTEIDRVIALLPGGAETFFRPNHGRIFELLLEVRKAEDSLDPIALLARMDQRDFARLDKGLYLQECMAACPTPAQAGYYAREVTNAWLLRNAQDESVQTLQRIERMPLHDASDAVRDAQRRVGLLPTGPAATSIQMWDEVSPRVAKAAEEAEIAAQTETRRSITSGWPELDKLTGGLEAGRVTILAARPGMGKSVAGLNIAQHVAMRLNEPVIWFSMEMLALECAQRMMCAGSRVYWDRMRDGKLDDHDWTSIAGYMRDTEGAPLGFDDTPGMTSAHMEATIETFVRTQVPQGKSLGLIGIDYLGLIKPTPMQQKLIRQEFIDMLTQAFHEWAKRWNTHVLALAQLNRGPEQRTNKRPGLADLRESGGIEQNAHNVLFIHRPEYYDKNDKPGLATFDLAKCRGGPTGEFELAAQLHMARFVSMAM